MLQLTWLIPALPLAGFLIIMVLGRKLGEPLAGWFATLVVGASFVATGIVFLGLRGHKGGVNHQFGQTLFSWIPVGGFKVDVGFLVDPLSITMCLFVTGIATLIHLYSIGYMHGDPKFSKFFLYLNLFVFSMLILVLGNNLLLTFVGWEGVGTCSYLLISFWHTKDANATAGKKAFVTNRIGDWGFMVAIFLTFTALGSVNYTAIQSGAGGLARSTATAIALLLFVGAVGKSAQLPLMVWLPDAMAGPTPVSALIHAATMVTAGVYLLVRMSPVLAVSSPWVPTLIACVGAITALFAATVALAQSDIKKVLAYSTISQLGYMFLAVGMGAYSAAIFHMVTHAFFKALLFLGSGSVIHGMGDEQDMRKMGGLRKLMPITAITFIVGWLAIAGVPPFAGFWSKDDILLAAWNHGGVVGYGLWFVGLVTAILTAFYMSRQVFLTFYGKPRWTADDAAIEPAGASIDPVGSSAEAVVLEAAADAAAAAGHDAHADGHGHGDGVHPHESVWQMTFPLVVLAACACIAGLLDLPFKLGPIPREILGNWLGPVVGHTETAVHVASATKVGLAAVAVIGGLAGIAVAFSIYIKRRFEDQPHEPELLAHAWYYDSTIAAFVGGPGRRAFDAVAWFDAHIVDGAVNGVAAVVKLTGSGVRRLQTGYVRTYALGIAIGAIVLVSVLVLRSGVR